MQSIIVSKESNIQNKSYELDSLRRQLTETKQQLDESKEKEEIGKSNNSIISESFEMHEAEAKQSKDVLIAVTAEIEALKSIVQSEKESLIKEKDKHLAEIDFLKNAFDGMEQEDFLMNKIKQLKASKTCEEEMKVCLQNEINAIKSKISNDETDLFTSKTELKMLKEYSKSVEEDTNFSEKCDKYTLEVEELKSKQKIMLQNIEQIRSRNSYYERFINMVDSTDFSKSEYLNQDRNDIEKMESIQNDICRKITSIMKETNVAAEKLSSNRETIKECISKKCSITSDMVELKLKASTEKDQADILTAKLNSVEKIAQQLQSEIEVYEHRQNNINCNENYDDESDGNDINNLKDQRLALQKNMEYLQTKESQILVSHDKLKLLFDTLKVDTYSNCFEKVQVFKRQTLRNKLKQQHKQEIDALQTLLRKKSDELLSIT